MLTMMRFLAVTTLRALLPPSSANFANTGAAPMAMHDRSTSRTAPVSAHGERAVCARWPLLTDICGSHWKTSLDYDM